MDPISIYPSIDSLRRLTSVTGILASARSADEVVELGVRCAAELLRADRAAIVLADAGGVLRVKATHGLPGSDHERFDGAVDGALSSRIRELLGVEPEAGDRLLSAPLIVRGRIPGVLALARPARVSEPDDGWLLAALADQISVAIDAARESEVRGRLERELEKVRQRTTQALDMAKHDVRAPLNAILGYLELLATGDFGSVSDAQKDVLERVRGVGGHLHAVLENALGSPAEAPRAAEEVAAAALVREAAALVAPAAREKRIDLELDVDERCGLRCSADRLRQALVNVLDNAVKYSPAGTAVRVRAHTLGGGEGPRCRIEVDDDGPGIPEERAEEVFAFGKRLPALGEDPGGSGIGLFVARKLIEEMGGRIHVLSGSARGTLMRIDLPAAGAEPSPRPH